ncbi:hypothetical protein RJ640_007441 [Escallonia rubra]|uniref:Uncharacterized protein n=1 Tax=Escallonia rubra TaxID=112253 RepID=A0AA88RU40_9ASTE|nr:hypothetical protein RJ640_007441 [Escallonia rubra]
MGSVNRMQSHFESIQRIADTTLPHALIYLSNRVVEELDLLHLWERLERGKRQPDTLTPSEKLELWDRLKILTLVYHGTTSTLPPRTILRVQ